MLYLTLLEFLFQGYKMQVFKNNVTVFINQTASSSTTSIVLDDASDLPVLGGADWFTLTFYISVDGVESNWEIVKVTNVSGNTITCVRGFEGTTQREWPAGAVGQIRNTANTLLDLVLDTNSAVATANNSLGIANSKASSLDLISNSGSSLIGHIASGTGAAARTVQSKLREFVSVKDFGAVGDGVTDDTAAINLAITAVGAAGGGIIYFPAGTYIVDRVGAAAGNFDLDVCIDVQVDNVHLVGAGIGATIIKKAQNTTSAHVVKFGRRVGTPILVDNCSLSDLTVYGNRLTVGTPANSNIDVSSGATRVIIERINSEQSTGYGIGMQRDAFIGCRISDAYITDCNNDGIDWKMDVNNSGYGNIVENITVLRFGLNVTPGTPQSGVNIRTGVSAKNIYCAEYGAENTGFRVDGSLDTTATQQSFIDNIKCVCTGGLNSKGIHTSGVGFKMSNAYATGAAINYWIRTVNGEYTNISSVAGTDGIYIYADAADGVNNNTFTNVHVSGATTGIRVSGSGPDLVGNTFINAVLESNTTHVLIAAGVLRTMFIGGSIPAMTDSGTGTQIFGTTGASSLAGPVQIGRNAQQHWKISGDGSNNDILGVSVGGSAKANRILSDANSGELRLYTLANQDVVFYRNNAVRLRITDLEVRPGNDNLTSSGSASARWSVVYAGTGTINTSDEKAKQQIRKLSEAEKSVAFKLKSLICAFKFNDAVNSKGSEARIHFGVIAQEVVSAFKSEGLNPMEYGVICYDEWDDVPEQLDEEGNLIQAYIPAGNIYGVRYEELLAFMIAAL